MADTQTSTEEKRYSSQGTEDLQWVEERFSNAAHRVARAVEKGFGTYKDEREKSAKNRRDGALVDGFENVAKGISEAVAEVSPAINDVAGVFNSRRTRSGIRTVARFLTLPLSCLYESEKDEEEADKG